MRAGNGQRPQADEDEEEARSLLERQRERMRGLDEHLDALHASAQRIEHASGIIGEEVRQQTSMMAEVSEDVEDASAAVSRATDKAADITEDDGE